MQSYLKYIFTNIEKLYNENQDLLNNDDYRPCKSVPRDIFAAFNKFKEYFISTNKIKEITRDKIIKNVLGLNELNDTVNTNIRLMKEFRFLEIDDGNYIFTSAWEKYIEDNKEEKTFILDELKKCCKMTDFNMVLNSILCTLREGYYFGEIICFPDSFDDYKSQVTDKSKRIEFCKRVYEIYGFHGRNKDIESDTYTPNANYRVLSILRKIGFIEQCESNNNMTTYNLTEDAILFLKEYNKVLGDKRMSEIKPFENFEYEVFDEKNEEQRYGRIIFGAPGTGKSHQLDKDKDKIKDLDVFERVTFHPNYSYSHFVGTYKPVTEGKDIVYKYVPGPFIRLLTEALENAKDKNKENRKRYLLIIEEMNRANVSAVFGDMFQLLDRKNGVSEYEIQTSEDIRKYLAEKLGGDGFESKYKSLKIPNNMYIWATMNSADQGVQPLDTAFKRRWEFEYLNINNSEEKIDVSMQNIKFPNTTMNWNLLRHLINNRISSCYNINEDKLLGPFFVKKGNQSDEQFLKSFKSKVLMYLFEDVCKINPKPLFAGIEKQKFFFSDVVETFDKKGLDIFKFSEEEITKAKSETKNKDSNATE